MEASNNSSHHSKDNGKQQQGQLGNFLDRMVRFADPSKEERISVAPRSRRIHELKSKLRKSFMEDDSTHKSWHGKDYQYDYSSSDDDDHDEFGEEDDFSCCSYLTDKSENFRALAQKEMDRSESFHNGSYWKVPEDLQLKNLITGKTKNGVSKKRLADLKGVLQEGILDTSFKKGMLDATSILGDSSNSNGSRNKLMSQSLSAGNTRHSATTNKLLNVMVHASQERMSHSALRRTGHDNTKVAKKQVEKAANKIQTFMRQSLVTLRRFHKEREYWERVIADTERRRQEDLASIQQWIQNETAEYRLQLERDRNKAEDSLWTVDDWESFQMTQDFLKQQIVQYKTENQTIQKDIKKLDHECEISQLEATNPERAAERARLAREVKKQTKDKDDWSRLVAHYRGAIDQATAQLETMDTKRKAKRKERKKIEKTICKIIELTQEQSQGEENAKLIGKITKLKNKREKKIEKLKEQTIKDGMIRPASRDLAEEQPSKRESSRHSKSKVTAPVNDLPDLEEMERSQHQQKPGSVKKKKRLKEQTNGGMITSLSKNRVGEETSKKDSSRCSKSKTRAPVDELPDLEEMERSKHRQTKKKEKKEKKEKMKVTAADEGEQEIDQRTKAEHELEQLLRNRRNRAEGEGTWLMLSPYSSKDDQEIDQLTKSEQEIDQVLRNRSNKAEGEDTWLMLSPYSNRRQWQPGAAQRSPNVNADPSPATSRRRQERSGKRLRRATSDVGLGRQSSESALFSLIMDESEQSLHTSRRLRRATSDVGFGRQSSKSALFCLIMDESENYGIADGEDTFSKMAQTAVAPTKSPHASSRRQQTATGMELGRQSSESALFSLIMDESNRFQDTAKGEDTFSKMAEAAVGPFKSPNSSRQRRREKSCMQLGLSPYTTSRRQRRATTGRRFGRQSSVPVLCSFEESDADEESDAPSSRKAPTGGASRSSALHSLVIEEDIEGERNL